MKLFPLLRLVSRSGLVSGEKFNPASGTMELESSVIYDWARGKYVKKILLGASEELVITEGASERIQSGASEKEEKNLRCFSSLSRRNRNCGNRGDICGGLPAVGVAANHLQQARQARKHRDGRPLDQRVLRARPASGVHTLDRPLPNAVPEAD